MGYIVDRTGFNVFKEEVLQGINPGDKAKVARHISFGGYNYDRNSDLEYYDY